MVVLGIYMDSHVIKAQVIIGMVIVAIVLVVGKCAVDNRPPEPPVLKGGVTSE